MLSALLFLVPRINFYVVRISVIRMICHQNVFQTVATLQKSAWNGCQGYAAQQPGCPQGESLHRSFSLQEKTLCRGGGMHPGLDGENYLTFVN
ncbi:hypothetical protein ETW24_09845 [Leisingera sp. NJS204]|nr:hypothetical protein ETW24_09845 [Leisingera sp. NJS204]